MNGYIHQVVTRRIKREKVMINHVAYKNQRPVIGVGAEIGRLEDLCDIGRVFDQVVADNGGVVVHRLERSSHHEGIGKKSQRQDKEQ